MLISTARWPFFVSNFINTSQLWSIIVNQSQSELDLTITKLNKSKIGNTTICSTLIQFTFHYLKSLEKTEDQFCKKLFKQGLSAIKMHMHMHSYHQHTHTLIHMILVLKIFDQFCKKIYSFFNYLSLLFNKLIRLIRSHLPSTLIH